jgi:hypothetical protein
LFYSLTTTTAAGSGRHQRVSRFEISAANTNAGVAGSEVPLITQRDDYSNHTGGDLHFGPDGYLYISLGDEGDQNDRGTNSQRIDQDFFSGILRIDVDKRSTNLAPNPHPALRRPAAAVDGTDLGAEKLKLTVKHARRLSPRRIPKPGEPMRRVRSRTGHELDLLDVSAVGALIEGRVRLLPNTHLDLHLVLHTGRTLVRCRIVRAHVCHVEADLVRYRAGLVFDQPIDSSSGYSLPDGGVRDFPSVGIAYPDEPPIPGAASPQGHSR